MQLKEPRANAIFATLLKVFLQFLAPLVAAGKLSPPLRALYKGALRLLLVLLHDFGAVLDTHHVSLVAAIAPRCHQMRNLVLSAFPPHVKLMDPFAPRLRFDAVPEMKQARAPAPLCFALPFAAYRSEFFVRVLPRRLARCAAARTADCGCQTLARRVCNCRRLTQADPAAFWKSARMQDPDIALPDFQRELGATLYQDLDAYLHSPASEDGRAVLASLPGRLAVVPAGAGGAGGVASVAGAPATVSTALVTHVVLRVALFSLQVRSSVLCSRRVPGVTKLRGPGASVLMAVELFRVWSGRFAVQSCVLHGRVRHQQRC
jgi:CCR4-Not complex component, Not1